MLQQTFEQRPRTRPGRSNRLALTYLVQLALADPSILDRLLDGEPLELVLTHPHFVITFDARDRATLADICARARTARELLANLADVVDGGVS